MLELNESDSILENIQDSYYKNLFKCGSKLINTREITEKFSEMALVSKGIELSIPDDLIYTHFRFRMLYGTRMHFIMLPAT